MMARQVYFDPYGQRVEGFRAGVQDMMNLQDNVRRARASDWDYNNMAPLRLSAAQRQDEYGRAKLPYDINALGINQRMAVGNLFDADQRRNWEYGATRADYAPAFAAQDFYHSGRYLDAPQYLPTYQQFIQPGLEGRDMPSIQALAELNGIDPRALMQVFGSLYGSAPTPEAAHGMDQWNLWDRTRQYANDNAGYTARNAQLGYQAQNAATAAQNAATQAYYANRGQAQYGIDSSVDTYGDFEP